VPLGDFLKYKIYYELNTALTPPRGFVNMSKRRAIPISPYSHDTSEKNPTTGMTYGMRTGGYYTIKKPCW